jgi:hypothetical protein
MHGAFAQANEALAYQLDAALSINSGPLFASNGADPGRPRRLA